MSCYFCQFPKMYSFKAKRNCSVPSHGCYCPKRLFKRLGHKNKKNKELGKFDSKQSYIDKVPDIHFVNTNDAKLNFASAAIDARGKWSGPNDVTQRQYLMVWMLPKWGISEDTKGGGLPNWAQRVVKTAQCIPLKEGWPNCMAISLSFSFRAKWHVFKL